jgi:hypothetical protein
MKELSLHILDLVQNSIAANASLITIAIEEDLISNRLTLSVVDNGKGMSEEFLQKVRDPFTTTRKTRPVGMGISLLESAAKACGGALAIQSQLGVGTKVTASFQHDHIDREPIGDMAETFVSLVGANPKVDFVYRHRVNQAEFVADTREMRQLLGEVPLDSMEVLSWMKGYIKEGIDSITGGETN